jgi:D-hexose-6-phosphate mutarotase
MEIVVWWHEYDRALICNSLDSGRMKGAVINLFGAKLFSFGVSELHHILWMKLNASFQYKGVFE